MYVYEQAMGYATGLLQNLNHTYVIETVKFTDIITCKSFVSN